MNKFNSRGIKTVRFNKKKEDNLMEKKSREKMELQG